MVMGNPIPETGYLIIDLPPDVTMFESNETLHSNVRCEPDASGIDTCACKVTEDSTTCTTSISLSDDLTF